MKSSDKFPRLLVIGNCCLSDSTSNGRTLKNFLIGWPKDKLAQFCIRFEKPDYSVCDNYYCVSDRDALNAFKFKGAKNGTAIPSEEKNEKAYTQNPTQTTSDANAKKISRNAFSAYLREIIWSSKRWRGKYFDKLVADFHPEVILLQVGD